MRALIATRLAHSGAKWAKIFARYNSGTYNNQWMVIDYNKFEPGHALKKGTFWVLEQMPGILLDKIVMGCLCRLLSCLKIDDIKMLVLFFQE